MRTLQLSALALLISPLAHATSDDIRSWAESMNSSFSETFSNTDPAEAVPGYSSESTGNEAYADNPNQMTSDAVDQAATDEAAQLIHGMPSRPNVEEQGWYQGATDITSNPSEHVDGMDGEYSDCEEVTTPGSTYTETRNCTATYVPETATCAEGLAIDVDANYLYQCNKEMQSSNSTCTAGRIIDVTQAHDYMCQEGRTSRTKQCDDELQVTVEKTQYKYLPMAMCRFTASQYNNYDLDHNYLELPKSTLFSYSSQEMSGYIRSAKKLEDSCTVQKNDVYRGGSSGWTTIFSGTTFTGCRTGDALWEDGYCHSDEPIVYQNAAPSCSAGDYSDGTCIQQSVWITDYIKDKSNSYRNSRMFLAGYGTVQGWWALRDGSGAYYYIKKSGSLPSQGTTYTATLNGSSSGYPRSATIKVASNRKSGVGGTTYTYSMSILLSTDPTAPTYDCTSGSVLAGTAMCSSAAAYPEYRIIDDWVKTCN